MLPLWPIKAAPPLYPTDALEKSVERLNGCLAAALPILQNIVDNKPNDDQTLIQYLKDNKMFQKHFRVFQENEPIIVGIFVCSHIAPELDGYAYLKIENNKVASHGFEV